MTERESRVRVNAWRIGTTEFHCSTWEVQWNSSELGSSARLLRRPLGLHLIEPSLRRGPASPVRVVAVRTALRAQIHRTCSAAVDFKTPRHRVS